MGPLFSGTPPCRVPDRWQPQIPRQTLMLRLGLVGFRDAPLSCTNGEPGQPFGSSSALQHTVGEVLLRQWPALLSGLGRLNHIKLQSLNLYIINGHGSVLRNMLLTSLTTKASMSTANGP